MTRSKSSKISEEKNSKIRYILTVVPVTLIVILFSYMIIQYITERLGISPVIILFSNSWFTGGESVILYIVWLSISIVIGLIISHHLRSKYNI